MNDPQTSNPFPDLPPGQNEVILVVEDDEDVRLQNVEMLSELGYRVLEAADGRAALRLLESEPAVQLLFTDVGLPGGLNGRQLATHARQHLPGLKILFATGYGRNAFEDDHLDTDVELLSKPFTYVGLATKLRQMLTA